MKKFYKIATRIGLVLLALAVIAVGAWMALIFRLGCDHHPAPDMTIYNEFNESVNIYFNGGDVGKIEAHASKIFYPGENNILINRTILLVEAKSNQGATVYSKEFVISELASKRWKLTISPEPVPQPGSPPAATPSITPSTAPSVNMGSTAKFDISKPPKVGEPVNLTFTCDITGPLKPVTKVWLEFERYDPAVFYPLGRGKAYLDWVKSAIKTANPDYAYLKYALQEQPESVVPADSVVLTGNARWDGEPLKPGDQVKFATTVRFPE